MPVPDESMNCTSREVDDDGLRTARRGEHRGPQAVGTVEVELAGEMHGRGWARGCGGLEHRHLPHFVMWSRSKVVPDSPVWSPTVSRLSRMIFKP